MIEGYYTTSEERPDAVRDLFDASAPAYDRITGLMSFGSGARYRRDVLRRIGIGPGVRVLDVACGTGQVAVEARSLVGDQGEVIGVDPSPGMRAVAEKRGIATRSGTAEALPLPDCSVDFVTMGYALRHVSDLVVAFREMHRVLRPGGTVCALEITAPRNRLLRGILKVYLNSMIPPLSHIVSGNRDAARLMTYYWETIDQCVPPEDILQAMKQAGFETPKQTITAGIFREYIGRRADAPGEPQPLVAESPSSAAVKAPDADTHSARVLHQSSPRLHQTAAAMTRYTLRQCVRITMLHGERLNDPETRLLAPTHVGHIEPCILSALRDRPVHWMTRIEFYKFRIGRWALRRLMAFPVHRQGVPVSAIRCAIGLIRAGRTVGMFPEGGVARGAASMMRGALPRGGVCTISMRTGTPIVPVAVVGTEALSTVRPWVPYQRGRLWIAVGEPVAPPRNVARSTWRRERRAMTLRLGRAYVALRAEIDAMINPA